MEKAKELHAPIRRKFCQRKIITKGIDDLWAADFLKRMMISSTC